MKELHFIDFDEIAYANIRVGKGPGIPPKKQRVRLIMKSGAVVTLEHPKAIEAVSMLISKKSTQIENYGLNYQANKKRWRIETEEMD